MTTDPITNPNESTNSKQTVQKIAQAYQMLETRFSLFRQEALRNYRYVVGDQIDKDILDQLKAEKRPALIFNLIKPIIIYIAGVLAQNKQAMKATPIRFGDEGLADLHTLLVSDFAVDGCEGYEEIVKASIDAAIAKVGWINSYWSTRIDPEGKAIIESTDPFAMMWDPDGKKIDQSDWRYQTFSGMYGADEIIAIYDSLSPEMRTKIKTEAQRIEGAYQTLGKPQGWLNRIVGTVLSLYDSFRSAEALRDSRSGLINSFTDSRNGLYRVIEWHEKRMISKKWLYDPNTREETEIPEGSDEQTALQSKPGAHVVPINTEQLWRVVCAPGLLPDDVILEEPYAIQGKGFQHKPVFWHTLHPDLLASSSTVDDLISPSDSYNQRRMTMLEYLMDTVNPPIEAPEDSISPEYLDDWKSKERGIIKFFKVQGGSKPERKPPQIDKAALQAFFEEDRDLTQKTSGVTPNSLGYAESSNEPSSLYRQRVQQGLVMMAFSNSHILRSMKNVFRYVDAMLQQYMTFPRIVRLASEPPSGMNGVEAISKGDEIAYWLKVNWPTIDGVLNDTTQGEYDFKPDFTQLGETARQMKNIELMEFLKVVPPETVDWPAVYESSDNPTIKKMAAYAAKVVGAAQAQQEQQQQLQQAAAETGLVANAAKAQSSIDPIQQSQGRAA